MIDSFIAHLNSQLDQTFVKITHAADQQPIDDITEELPLLGVFPGPDSTQVDPTDFVESKMITSEAIVHIVCLIEELETLRTAVRSEAMGWNAGPMYTDMTLKSGELLQLKAGICWWEERYTSAHLIRA
ncbi:phage tail terminator protein [Pseudohongiella spirulinae]|uniref:Uncharacterized protein n=1 Tax=Pseudohongiella spirulinae TaxID=1249552 RepID=A0A0S2KEN0_9GAMM|nr:hypothetical protein [Pseudohongiella spirulinae]ALO46574.1 hypothetical protein PS2015_1928 [Pseudohongiella spirulinae]